MVVTNLVQIRHGKGGLLGKWVKYRVAQKVTEVQITIMKWISPKHSKRSNVTIITPTWGYLVNPSVIPSNGLSVYEMS